MPKVRLKSYGQNTKKGSIKRRSLHEMLEQEHSNLSWGNPKKQRYWPIIHQNKIAWVFYDKEVVADDKKGQEYLFSLTNNAIKKPWDFQEKYEGKYEVVGWLQRVREESYRDMLYHEPTVGALDSTVKEKILKKIIKHLEETGWTPGEYR